MKKLLSLFILFVFFIIGLIHSSMMAFAIQENIENDLPENIVCYGVNNTDNSSKCENICCLEKSTYHGISFINTTFQSKVVKVSNKTTSIGKNTLNLYYFKNDKLVNKTSPPYFKRYIDNYSYHTLIKIIKSNT